MTENGASRTLQDPAWQLLADFSPPAGPGSEHQLAGRVTGAMRELGLQPEQMERVRKAVVEAVRHATKRGNKEQQNSSVSIRIWISGVCAQDRSRFSPDAQQNGQQERCGWGFFMIEKCLDDPQTAKVELRHVIELFLYQERILAEKKRRS